MERLERFYDNVWKQIIDYCMYNVDGVEAVRYD